MKVCERCGDDVDGLKDGENVCRACEDADEGEGAARKAKRAKANAARRSREAAFRSCGLVKVRGALGGTYWE